MNFRRRIVLLSAAAVALAVLLSAIVCYLAVDRSLRGRVNHQLTVTASSLAAITTATVGTDHRPPLPVRGGAPARIISRIAGPSLQTTGEAAVFSDKGTIYGTPEDHASFHLTSLDLAVARGTAPAYFREGKVGRTAVRVYVRPAGRGRAVIALQSLTDLHNTLSKLAEILGTIALAGIALAGIFGFLVARAAASPVHALRRASEHVGSTGDLTRRIDTTGNDDLGRLGDSFNTMLDALEESQRAQQQLIGDASHELRTPIASLRVNLEVLARNPDMDLSDRTPLLDDLIGQSNELGELVDDLLDSARDGGGGSGAAPMSFDKVVSSESERWGAQHPDIQMVRRVERCEIVGQEARVRRAVSNILDNAIKWSPHGGSIEIDLSDATLRIRDHGPGFSEEDLPHVFDRFYRSPRARSVPGSGLGLSIVRRVAKEHNGHASARNTPSGGAEVTLDLSAARSTPLGAPATSATSPH